MFSTVAILLILLATAGFFLGRRRALQAAARQSGRLHSLPDYYGVYVALWIGLPSFILVLAWLALQGPVIENLILATLPERLTQDAGPGQMGLYLSKIKSILSGQVFGEPDPALKEAAARYETWRALSRWAMLVVALSVGIAALVLTRRRIALDFWARNRVETITGWIMIACSTVAILTTLGIVLSLTFEALRFFDRVPITEFLFGLNWEPQIPMREGQVAGSGAFGMIPVFTGTILIALMAMVVAGPVGLLSAIYLSEYASPRVRGTVKPLLEILAGIPTVVYGFFAVLVVSPALRNLGDSLGVDIASNSALVAGAVMGIMILPFVSSLSDDALSAVPQAMRNGSYAMGATQAETIRQVLIAAALPGIVGGFLLAVSRAIGETMIVVMAAGLMAKLTANPLEAVTTVTVQIVTLLIGDTSFDNPKTLAAFALGLMLFLATLGLNVIALRIVQKYREKYE